MKRLKISIACAFAMFVFASCRSNSTGPNGGGGTPLSAAYPGSTFHFTVTQTDTMGNSLGSPSTLTDSITAIGITWQGKSNVIEGIGTDNQGNSSTGYYSLLDNGDVALYLGPVTQGIVSQWLTLPFSSGQTVSTTIEDLTQSNSGFSSRVQEVATYSPGPDSSAIIQGTQFKVKQVIGTYTVTQTTTVPGFGTQTSTNILPPFHYYWAPSLGFLAGSRFVTTDMYGNADIETQSLTSYTIR